MGDMTNWNEGYRSDIEYSICYNKGLNPTRIRFAFLLAGLLPPQINRVCELGFGQGVSLAIHAAANGGEWHGNDFMPSQVLYAQSLCDAGGIEAHLSEDSFRDYTARDDLPKFDMIALHGVWTWVSDDNRAAILAFIRKNLRPGGVVYVSYNTLVGHARFMALREWLIGSLPSSGDHSVVDLVEAAKQELNGLLAIKPKYIANDAHLIDATNRFMNEKDYNYIAHEYLNSHWKPVNFSEISDAMKEEKLEYACFANLMLFAEAYYLTKKEREFIQDQGSINQRENTRDIISSCRFRSDYWMRGGIRLPAAQRDKLLNELRFVLSETRDLAEKQIIDNIGISEISEEKHLCLIAALADGRPHRLDELAEQLSSSGLSSTDILQMLAMACATGVVSVCRTEAEIASARPTTDRLNRALLEKAAMRDEISCLASPLTGGGVTVRHIDKLLLLARLEGHDTHSAQAAFVKEHLEKQGAKLKSGSTMLDGEDAALAQLSAYASKSEAELLPLLKALGIA